MENKSHVPNHQPDAFGWWVTLTSILNYIHLYPLCPLHMDLIIPKQTSFDGNTFDGKSHSPRQYNAIGEATSHIFYI